MKHLKSANTFYLFKTQLRYVGSIQLSTAGIQHVNAHVKHMQTSSSVKLELPHNSFTRSLANLHQNI